MYPAARIGDPISHDDTVPCGLIAGPPNPMTVTIESLPAAHATDAVLCSGVIQFGLVHLPIPPEPAGPPNKILSGSPTVYIHGLPAARWSPSFDMTTCLSKLGLSAATPGRTVFIGNGVPAIPMKIAIVKGTAFDSAEGREKLFEMIANAQDILGMAIQVESVTVLDDPGLKTLEKVGLEFSTDVFGNVTSSRLKVYSGQATLDAIEAHGSPDTPIALFSDWIEKAEGGTLFGQAIHRNPGNNTNEGILVSNEADMLTFAHEIGHLLTHGLDHSDDTNNVMYGFGKDEDGHVVTGREWTDPWKSHALKHRYVTAGTATICPICGGLH